MCQAASYGIKEVLSRRITVHRSRSPKHDAQLHSLQADVSQVELPLGLRRVYSTPFTWFNAGKVRVVREPRSQRQNTQQNRLRHHSSGYFIHKSRAVEEPMKDIVDVIKVQPYQLDYYIQVW